MPPDASNQDAVPSASEETIQAIEAVLDHIYSNLRNICNTWGTDSIQYQSAVDIMDQYLNENPKKLRVEKSDLERLMANLSLDK